MTPINFFSLIQTSFVVKLVKFMAISLNRLFVQIHSYCF